MVLYDLQQAGYGLSKSTSLGFASKGINTCNVHGCELACVGWEGVNDFRLDKQCASYQVQVLDFLTVTVEIGVDYHKVVDMSSGREDVSEVHTDRAV